MELTYLREFLTLMDEGSYYGAAMELYISQSALSKHIRKLENELGGELFDHSKRVLELTPVGKCFYKYAVQMTELEKRLQAELGQLIKEETKIVLGRNPLAGEYGIIELVDEFEKNLKWPVETVQGSSKQLLSQLKNGKLNMVFVENNNDTINADGEFAVVPYRTDFLCALLPSGHPLAGEKQLHIGQLREELFIEPPPNNRTSRYFMEMCADGGFVPQVVYRAYQPSEIMDLVRRKKGISVMKYIPMKYYSRLFPTVRLVELCPHFQISIDLVYRKDGKLSEVERLFVRWVEQNAIPDTGFHMEMENR